MANVVKVLDTIVWFFRNKWTKIGFSALSLGYGFFMLWLAWLTFSFYLVPTNPVSLFALYLLINVLFGAVMIYTRKEIATQITACLLHPCILIMLVFAFGEWFLLMPVFVTATVVFFVAGTPESLKTVLGTIYLILFVLTTLGYLTLQTFAITSYIFPVNLELRSDIYIYSTDNSYRLVLYIDKEKKEHRTIAYHAEFTGDDMSLPFLNCERYNNSTEIQRIRLPNDFEIERVSDNKLIIREYGIDPDSGIRIIEGEKLVEWTREGRVRIDGTNFDAPDFKSPVQQQEDNFTSETVPLLPGGDVTRGTTTPPNIP
ncbi:MAG: hypothetical protein LBC82_05090 [Oscillospiraceae bacterium]|jgi:hypothetical protein|nr:hypothetical protein [Oscillospiraceae bacterium]